MVSRLGLLILLWGKDGGAVVASLQGGGCVSRRAPLSQNVTEQQPGHRGCLTGTDFGAAWFVFASGPVMFCPSSHPGKWRANGGLG